MGKKIKKGPNPLKVHQRSSAGSPKSVLEGSGPNIGSVGYGDRDKEACNHCTQSTSEMNLILLKIRSSSLDVMACEYCREEPVSKRGGKEKVKQPKKKGLGSRAAEAKSDQISLWVCLDCGQYLCGGEFSVSEPYGHARRHAKQKRHQWAVRADNPLVSWCYSCSSSVPIQLPEEVITEESKEAMHDWSSNLRGNAVEPLDSEKLKGHKVRGLSNLGNTCFFNSIMQNFFAMDLLRDRLLVLNRSVGPLSMELKMLFVETSRSAESRGVVNPKALFGCICAKAPQFRGYHQQDSHELLRYLLDGLQMEETNANKASELANNQGKFNAETGATLVDTIFGGRLSSTVSCMECGHTSVVNEPFLDLSLPVPSKKPPPKKLIPPPPKRANQRDKNKTRRFRERVVAQASTMSVSQKEENIEQPSECSESGIDVPLLIHDNAYEAQEFTWMDYIGDESPNCNDFGDQEKASVVQSSLSKQENEIDSNAQSVSVLQNETESSIQSSKFHTANCSNDLTASLNSSAERSCKDEIPHSCVPVPGVIFLPYKEQVHDLNGLDANNRTFSRDPVDTNPIDTSISESCAANSTYKQVEEDFDGFGDLFNEPEVTSEFREETNSHEDMDITLWIDDISESNLEEVDDTNAPVSIYNCLALFTKPELLSDEQAWYCECCSELLLQENRELGTSKLQASKVSDQPVIVKSMVNEDEFRSKRFASNSHWDSSIVEGLDNGKSVSSPKNVATQVEGNFDQIAVVNASQKPVSQAEGSHNSEEISCNEILHLSETAPCSNMVHLFDVLDKEMLDSETSQYFSTPAAVNSQTQDSSSDLKSTFHGINDQSSAGSVGKEPVDSHSLNSYTNVAPQKSSENKSQVCRVRKKGLKSGKVHPAKEKKGEGSKMVKRDATKRILIDSVPPILTIHLKRFSQDGRGRLSKLNGHVSFQERLDMSPYMDPRCIKDLSSYTYRLIGVVEHSGSMGDGHYVAYVRGGGKVSRTATSSSNNNSSTGKAWFYASDAYVREVSLDEVLQSEAYILFYEKM